MDTETAEMELPDSEHEIQQTVAGAKVAPEHAAHATARNGRETWWRRCGSKEKGFSYLDARGQAITDARKLERIHALVIPPAWEEVRIAPSPRTSLQVVGVDAAGRLQYHYSAEFVACQQRIKFAKIEHFGDYLPALRRQTNLDIAQDGLSRERVLAVIVRLVNDLYFRVGSEESVSRYKTFGVTTLRNRHLTIQPNGELLFQFIGKHHIPHRRLLVDEHLAELLREIKAIRGERLFNYLDANKKPHAVTPHDVNHYIKAATAPQFSAKDFRTWGGTLLAAIALAEMGTTTAEMQQKRNIVEAVRRVSERLGNTPAVCRGSYIHPIVFERYQQGVTLRDFRQAAQRAIKRQQPELEIEEVELLRLFATQPDC